jgi:hypothetical protein
MEKVDKRRFLEIWFDPTRFAILEFLLRVKSASHVEICQELGRSLGLWRHLEKLEDHALIIKEELTGKETVYSPNMEVLQDLVRYLKDMLN